MAYLMDMDGVLVHEDQAIPGADAFLALLRERGEPHLVLTNNSLYTPRDLSARLANAGLNVPPEAIWTSALATARFLDQQRSNGTAFAVGEAGLTTALHEVGYTLVEQAPDYVVLGEQRSYSLGRITQGDPADRRGRPLHRHQPRPGRSDARRPHPRDGRRRRTGLARDRRRPVLRRQAEPADDARGAAGDRRPLRGHDHGRRPHGH
jgi:hypothetical protein